VDRDPEVKYLPDGQAVANFSTANPPGRLGYQDVSGAIWSVNVNERVSTEVTVRGKLAEICGKYLAKGQKIEIRGPLETRRNVDGKRERVISLRPFISRVHRRKRKSVKAWQTTMTT
jgi:single-stranded DNA-binding protein